MTEGLRDSASKMVVVGYACPLCLVAIVIANIAVGRVYVLPGRSSLGNALGGLLQSYPYGWPFLGVVTAKLGLAASLFSWYALANYQSTERWAQPALLASIVVVALGVCLFGIGLFV